MLADRAAVCAVPGTDGSLGLSLRYDSDGRRPPRVAAVRGAAEAAGVQAGDELVGIDGRLLSSDDGADGGEAKVRRVQVGTLLSSPAAELRITVSRVAGMSASIPKPCGLGGTPTTPTRNLDSDGGEGGRDIDEELSELGV